MIIKLYEGEPYVWQKEVHDSIDSVRNDKQRIHTFVIKAARQIYGKTHLVMSELIKTALLRKCNCAYIAPSFLLSTTSFKSMYNSLYNANLLKSKNGSNYQLELINGSQIDFYSANQRDRLRGQHYSGLLVLDECIAIEDEVWTELVAPWTLVHKPIVLMISTPRYKDGFFWNEFNSKSDTSHIFDWTTKYPLEESEFLLKMKSTMPLKRYNCEYRGVWLENDGGVFGQFGHCLKDLSVKANEEIFVGIDWANGSGGDSTVVSGFNRACEQVLLFELNNMQPTQQINVISAELKKYRVRRLFAETNSMGTVFIDMLYKAGINVTPFNTTNDSKRIIIDDLRAAIENNCVSLNNNRELSSQLTFYEEDFTPSGKVSYNGAKGKHDDYVIATALSLHAWNLENKYSNVIKII